MDAKELFMNGEFVPAAQGTISVRAHGFAYGTGCFEGIRGYWNEADRQVYLFRVREHYERLHKSCRIIGIGLDKSVDELCDITQDLVRQNGYKEVVYIRPLAYKSSEIVGVRMHNLDDSLT